MYIYIYNLECINNIRPEPRDSRSNVADMLHIIYFIAYHQRKLPDSYTDYYLTIFRLVYMCYINMLTCMEVWKQHYPQATYLSYPHITRIYILCIYFQMDVLQRTLEIHHQIMILVWTSFCSGLRQTLGRQVS